MRQSIEQQKRNIRQTLHTHTYTYIHTYIHTYMHTYIHTHIHSRATYMLHICMTPAYAQTIYIYIYPPTSLSVERDRTPLEARSPSNTKLQSLQSIPAFKPTAYSSPSFGYCSLGLEQSFFRAHDSRPTARHRTPQGATRRHRTPQADKLSGTRSSYILLKPSKTI